MTEHDAINTLKYRMNTAIKIVGIGEDGKAFEDMEMAIKALEKQITKKLITHPNKRFHYCPSCGSYFGALVDMNYCMDCGQKLDWSE